MTNLATLSARDLAAGYATKAFTPTDVITALIAHIAAWEPAINALYAYTPDQAVREAAASTARWHGSSQRGPLDGIPASIKEMIPTKGTPTPLGSAATDLIPATEDAPPAARLREAGAIIFAKTTAPDYGMLSSGLSSFHKLARNPWNLANNPGGSSAGAAAAAAAGYGPLHVGTDIGGSIRLPAAWCGLVGFKPSLGRIPIDPYYIGRCAGPITRTVDDAAWMMQVLAQPDMRDATSLPAETIDWHARLDSPKNLRIGLMLEAGCGLDADPQINQAVTRAAKIFAAAGAHVVPVQPVLTRKILDGIDRFWRARLWADISQLPAARRRKILPFIHVWAEQGAHITGPEAAAGISNIFDLKRLCAARFADLDALLSPTTPNTAFPAEWASPLNDPSQPFEHIGFTLPWNMSEQPAISLNCGFAADGTPLGLQIVTPRFADQRALQLARWYEAVRGPIGWPAHLPVDERPL